MADQKQNPLIPLIRIVGKKVVNDAMGAFAVNDPCLDAVGHKMYADEEDTQAKPWASLTPREKKLWKSRAAQAIIGLREYVLT